jgi:hypothetical protein
MMEWYTSRTKRWTGSQKPQIEDEEQCNGEKKRKKTKQQIWIIWFSNVLIMRGSDDGYSINVS